MTAHDKTGVGSGAGDWRTPPDLYAMLNRRFAFTYDAWASHENALCRTYSTVKGTFRIESASGDVDQVDALDGLSQDWRGRRTFGNPPYSDPEHACLDNGRCKKKRCVSRGYCIDENVPGIPDFVAKHAAERNNADVDVALLPDARDTAWWRSFVKPHAQDFPIGRVRFINPATGEPGTSPPGGIAVVVWTPDWLDR